MIEFEEVDGLILLVYNYDPSYTSSDWVRESIKKNNSVTIKGVFYFQKEHLVDEIDIIEDEEEIRNVFDIEFESVRFKFAERKKNYYKIFKGVIIKENDIYFHQDMELSMSLFRAEKRISILSQISSLVNKDIIIGGENENAIPLEVFDNLIKDFPNSYEKKLYAEARIISVIKEYFDAPKDAERNFEKYLKKKRTKKGENLLKTFKDFELLKYQTIYDKLKSMLDDEFNYSEDDWQDEILQIIQLIYPKYFLVFKEAPIKASFNKQGEIREKDKRIDILLVDSNGHIDVIEIKKPFESALVTKRQYRDNFIPLRELSGTVMQIEKYIYYLNRWGYKGEEFLTERYNSKIPENFDIKITNPKGFIIMGREKGLTLEQKNDLEVIKRKYKNLIDIMSYDDLLDRLKFTIHQIKRI